MANQDDFEMGNGVIVSVVSFKYAKVTSFEDTFDCRKLKNNKFRMQVCVKVCFYVFKE